MWVRVATFAGGNTEKLDRLMDERMSSGEMTLPEGMGSVLILDDKDRFRALVNHAGFPDSLTCRHGAEPEGDRR